MLPSAQGMHNTKKHTKIFKFYEEIKSEKKQSNLTPILQFKILLLKDVKWKKQCCGGVTTFKVNLGGP